MFLCMYNSTSNSVHISAIHNAPKNKKDTFAGGLSPKHVRQDRKSKNGSVDNTHTHIDTLTHSLSLSLSLSHAHIHGGGERQREREREREREMEREGGRETGQDIVRGGVAEKIQSGRAH
jgi:hypothetical protein